MAFITAEQGAALRPSTVRPALLFYMASTPAVRVWTGPGPLEAPADTVETGGIYKGIGSISGWPAVDALINGVASRVDFTLSGLPTGYLSLADEDAETIRFAPVHLGAWFLGADWQPHPLFPTPLWVWSGTADSIQAELVGGDESTPPSATVTLSVGGGDTGRKSQRQSYWTGTDQRRRSADDAFCDLTVNYTERAQKRWPS
jgi:hypothetical protein